MANIIPTSIKDETGANFRQQAEANDRLAQLFYTLMAKREDREYQAALRRELAGDADRRWYERHDYANQQRQDAQEGPSSPGAQPSLPNGAPAPAAAPNGASINGSSPILGTDSFTMSDAGGSTTLTGGAGNDAMNANAQATSQQDLVAAKAGNMIRPSNAGKSPTTQLPRVRTQRTPPAQAQFRNVTPEVRAAWADAERQNGLPEGQLLFSYGLETGGGRRLGRADGKGPQGPFQWTPDLLAEKGLTVYDAQDMIKMGYATAKNMAENHAQLVKRTTAGGQAIQLSNSVADMKSWQMLHQWGRGAGPSIVAASKLNPGIPLAALLPKVGKDGKPIDPAKWLVNNGIHPEATVDHAYALMEQRGHPWRTAAVTGKGFVDSAQPQAAPAEPQVAGGQPQQQAQQAPQQQPPRPPANIPGDVQNSGAAVAPNVQSLGPLRAIRTDTQASQLTPEAGRAMQQLVSEFPGIRISSTYRGGRRGSQHFHRTAFDADFSKLSVPEKQAATRRAVELGAIGIGNYGNNSMHFDWRRGMPKVAWGPNKSHTSLHRAAPWFQQIAQAHRTGGNVGPSGVQTAQARAPQSARPTDTSAQRRSITQYPSTSPKPSELNPNIIDQPFSGAVMTARGAPAAPGTAQAAPAPQQAPQQQASLPPSFAPAPPQMTPPAMWGGQQQAPQAQQPYAPDPTTVPQDMPFEANYPQPPTVNLPMPRPKPVDYASEPPFEANYPLEMPMPQPRPDFEARGAQSVDEAGFDQYAPPPGALTMDAGDQFTGAQSVDEAGMMPVMAMPTANEFEQPRMDFAAGNEYAPPTMAIPGTGEFSPDVMATPGVAEFGGDVMAAAPGNEFEVPNMAAAAGNEFAPSPRLPGANLTMPTPQTWYTPENQLPADYMSPSARIQELKNKWPSPQERWKMQNDVRNALFNKVQQAFTFDPSVHEKTAQAFQSLMPQEGDKPMPTQGAAANVAEQAPQYASQVWDRLQAAMAAGKQNLQTAGSRIADINKPRPDEVEPPRTEGFRETSNATRRALSLIGQSNATAVAAAGRGISNAASAVSPVLQQLMAKAKEYQQMAQQPLFQRTPAQPAPATVQAPPTPTPTPTPTPAAPAPQQDTAPAAPSPTLVDIFKRTVPGQVAGYAAQGIGKGVDAISELFKRSPSAPQQGKATAAPTPSAMQPRPVKVERYGAGGQPVLPDGPPIGPNEIPPLNTGRQTTANTPIPFAQPGSPAATQQQQKPATAAPTAPKAGAGKAAGFKQWLMPDGSKIYTAPGEAPPPNAVRQLQ